MKAYENEGEEAKHVLVGIALGVAIAHVTAVGIWIGASAAAYLEGGTVQKAQTMGMVTNVGTALVVELFVAGYLLVLYALGWTGPDLVLLGTLAVLGLVVAATGGWLAGRLGHWARYQAGIDIGL